jgi:hypothetical protein
VKTTRYFEEQALRKRPYLRRARFGRIVAQPVAREVQADGRVRRWGDMPDPGGWSVRVVTLAAGETVHNALPDRGFVSPAPGAT